MVMAPTVALASLLKQLKRMLPQLLLLLQPALRLPRLQPQPQLPHPLLLNQSLLLQHPRLPRAEKHPNMMKSIRKWLLAGLLVIVPVMVTVWVLDWIVSSLDKTLQILPQAWHPDKLIGFHIPGFGVLLALAILLVVGAAASNFLGKKLVSWWDALLNRIPVVRSIYSSVKQVSDTLFSDGGNAFRTAVLVQWPRENVWTIAFITGTPVGEVSKYLKNGSGDEFVSVYVPTTPNPTGGYFVLLKKSDCIELKMSVDEALKYIVSMGVVVPGGPAVLPGK
jgi:uncharacterized membrane protein